MPARVLIVDDEISIRKVLSTQLRRHGLATLTASDGEEAIERLGNTAIDVVVTDLRMPGVDGMGVLAHVREHLPGLPVILITAHGTIDTAVEALKQGAFDYVTKPFDQDELREIVLKAVAAGRRTARQLHVEPEDVRAALPITLRPVADLVRRIGPTSSTALVSGPSGSGKRLAARTLHDLSPRASGPFVVVTCGAVQPEQLEAELFGRLAADASHRRAGRVELAEGGTLLLDEVHALPADVQVRVLRLLTDMAWEDEHGREHAADVRVLASTDRELVEEVTAGRFREDLFYRLAVVPIRLPPLSERLEDLEALAEDALERLRKRGVTGVTRLSEAALDTLRKHPWPGNVHEFESVLERSALLSESPTLDADDLSLETVVETEPVAPLPDDDDLDLKAYLRMHTIRLERHRIRRALEAEDGNVTRAARRLGISRRSLQTKMKDYGLRES